ncbi:Putative uncharacterized protein [Lactococcus lactis subsp. lactis A12]|uniref:Uncharacterized protein n=1 Tax=Lactococcus lactis subsp. lactis A12 TaxID=1137134 RepID=S6FEY6_LACLL|nr:Putative uncharacterized protein [Lactococcus lactis subsp. lactis A12]SBW30096.1 Hypothetical protein LLA12_00943 [Lactococcus lactis subsp. lactis]
MNKLSALNKIGIMSNI